MTNGPLFMPVFTFESFPRRHCRLRPELHGAACVIMAGEAPSEEVCSLNTKARLSGMKHDMSRVEIEGSPTQSSCVDPLSRRT